MNKDGWLAETGSFFFEILHSLLPGMLVFLHPQHPRGGGAAAYRNADVTNKRMKYEA